MKLFDEDATGGTTGDAAAAGTGAATISPATVAPSAENPAAAKLRSLGVDGETTAKIIQELGAETEADLSFLTEQHLVAASIGMKPIPAKRLLASITAAQPTAPVETIPIGTPVNQMSFDVLPPVPSDESWLQALRAGGVLKVDQSTVISAIRVALAHKVNLFGIPKRLVELMERFADENDEQVDPLFFKLRKELTRRSYAEVFEAIDGLDNNYVTQERKTKLLSRIDTHLWPTIASFNDLLQAWQDAYMKGATNPAIMMQTIMMASRGGAGMAPAMMQQVPETGGLRDAAEAVADSVNRVFAGTGVQIAAALAYEASQVKTTLTDVRLPALIGVANREQMLKKLDAAVPATYPRLELNLTRFVLSIMQVKDQSAGNEELIYFGSMAMLGSQIPWDQLGVGTLSKTGRRRPSGIGSEE